MLVDPAVSRRKFDIEVDRLRKQSKLLNSWGCQIVRCAFPLIDVLFVPLNPIRLSLPAGQIPGAPANALKAAFVTFPIPCLAGRAFGVRLLLDDYDFQPPSVTFRDHRDWERFLRYDELPRANNVDETGKAISVLLDKHPTFDRPFLCMRGTREYHAHPQHTGDDWLLYRGDVGAFTVLSTVWRTCIQDASPNLIVTPPNIQVRWEYQPEKP